MTNSTPQLLPTFARLRCVRFWPLLWLVPIGIVAGILSGALMNAVNGWISPDYFSMFSYTDNPYSFSGWLLVCHHGMLEGAVFGVIFSLIYASFVLLVSRGNCPLHIAFRGLLRAVALLGLTSLCFGLNAILVALLAPSWLAKLELASVDLKFLYVGASIWGIYFGGIIAVIVGCIWFSFDWRKYKSAHS